MRTPNIVSDWEAIQDYNTNKDCVCGNDLSKEEPLPKRWFEITDVNCLICPECDREFLIRDVEAVTPGQCVSIEKKDGIYEFDENDYTVFEEGGIISLISIIDRLKSHIEKPYPVAYDTVLYNVKDQKILGFLLDNDNVVHYIGVLPGYRRQGIGTELIMHWFNTKDLDRIPVRGWYDEADDFYESLPVDVENVS